MSKVKSDIDNKFSPSSQSEGSFFLLITGTSLVVLVAGALALAHVIGAL